MTLSALKGAGMVELQKELASLDPTPAAAAAAAVPRDGESEGGDDR